MRAVLALLVVVLACAPNGCCQSFSHGSPYPCPVRYALVDCYALADTHAGSNTCAHCLRDL